ncbi:MAG: hypothetical protein A2836_00510 [Candidatus Taylorbacteria bacterium RIFCSPHIGHO2_01_FULL_45_63]|uniref:ATP-cone domain-containing protein n=1 Tax=Candidatus Taylorbacteria bacterium RIFCSPHIGHO2_02_FULL_45_35 TaxID=1802311 RepID=A0A1G2MRW3_9BACT|nr:MAG: hypothetical protein A2836_00510 [Candidatus Taylorbacteria bacterium RIFCSPHIGHO2_01_FULL_45_63]OHA25742.1 MAG: hypothetical protein A3D56_03250 [Candidatus Taylorbacteria bacterium RIFCSPHIGHO2_02_FULL_45_35]OHA34818.1 MAG: hypothetical protein A3A22_00300 [Candidatus Taylorbacteria bacterium RIFCSPLOWO2_01_FULL_45_34b]
MPNEIYVVKADGEKELWSEDKLRESLKRARAGDDTVQQIVDHIKGELRDGVTTSHIYQHAFYLLHKIEKPVAARYSLRRALVGFGPSGFPFEKFLGELFRAQGYEVATEQIVKGACVEHEVDVVAWNVEKLIMTEAKFHNELGAKSDLKVALYVKARFDDLSEQMFDYGKRRPLDEGYLITNTKFTTNAIQYGECVNLKMIGWNYPLRGNLQDLIEDSGLHPITCLTSISVSEKQELLSKGVVLCRDAKKKQLLKDFGFKEEAIAKITDEADLLCQPYA